jgi:hypothetical protein
MAKISPMGEWNSQFATRRLAPIAVVFGLTLFFVAMGVYLWAPNRPSQRSPGSYTEDSSVALTSLKLPRVPGSLLDRYSSIDPQEDKWQSEAFHGHAAEQLHGLAKLVPTWPDVSDDQLAKWISERFRCTPLCSEDTHEVFRDDAVQVLRANVHRPLEQTVKGIQAFRAAINHWLEPLGTARELRLDTKISQVDLHPETHAASTLVHITLSGVTFGKPFQQNSIWHCTWTRPDDSSLPLLLTIEVQEFEQILATNIGGRLIADCTESILASNDCFRGQLCRGVSHWCERLVARMGVYLRSLHGITVADVNDDGLDDLFVCEPGGLPNRLFLQNADGSATDVSATSGINLLEPTRACVIADFDNDGHQDAALTMIYSAVAIFRGNGKGQFSFVRAIPLEGKAYSLISADFDGDGRLDLYACGYNDVAGEIGESGGGVPEPYYDANQGAPNVLLRNLGGFEFRDETTQVGLDVNNRRLSYAAAWEDFDNDGDLDLYVANDFGPNNLYRNDGKTFVDIAFDAGVEDIAAGMGVTWGDYDNDGWMDLYVANMWSSAGNRITFQDSFPAKDETTRSLFQRFARGNTLFRNRGNGLFEDKSLAARVTLGRWAWGTHFMDLNNDGFEDLAVANGFVTGEKSEDL